MIYLDNSATTPPFKEVIGVMDYALSEAFFNPSSAYAPAVQLHTRIEQGRAQMLRTLGVDTGRLIFTSGGTEANNLAVFGSLGALRTGKKHVVVSLAEHASVAGAFHTLQENGYDVTWLQVNEHGVLEPETLVAALREDTCLVSFMQVNNETGAINDILSLGTLVKKHCPKALVHCDGVQAYGRLTPDLNACPIDLYVLSAHKFHGPKGAGALYVREGVRIMPMLIGGGHEGGLRSGTTNAPAILGMLEAARICQGMRKDLIERLETCKLTLANSLLAIDGAVVNGPPIAMGAPHILNMSFMGVRGETLLHSLERYGIYVSKGSACSARSSRESRVLGAMGITGERALGAVRMSLGAFNTPEQMDEAAWRIGTEVEHLRKYRRM
ncbi:MAG: cysteine desulfurase family protein [Bacillota bacterium]